MSNKPITIRVTTAKLLVALNKALDERKAKKATSEKEWEAHEKAIKDFQESLAETFRSGKGKVTRVAKSGWREEGNKWDMTIEFPSSLKEPKEPKSVKNDWSLNNDIEELENAIALISLSDEEYANASTYKGVARFIK